MNPPEPPDFDTERRFHEALKFMDKAGASHRPFIEQLAELPPTDYVLAYRLRWWQLLLRPRCCLLASLARRFDRRSDWQERLDRRLLQVEGFDEVDQLDPARIWALRHLQLTGRLSAFSVFWACDVAACISATGMQRMPRSIFQKTVVACARGICIAAAAAVIGLLAIATSAYVTQRCLSCVSLGAGLMAAHLAIVTGGLYLVTFYRPRSIRRAQDGLQQIVGATP